MTDASLAKIVAAVREYNAAENSMRRAQAELVEAIPPGLTVLQKHPDNERYFWSYEKSASGMVIESAGGIEMYAGNERVIIEAPARRAEFLPRLES